MAGFGRDTFRGIDYDLTIRDIATRYLGTDWFSRDDNVRRHGLRSASDYSGFGNRDGWSMEEAIRIDDVRRINAMAQMANSMVTPSMRNAEIHPKLSTTTGQFPREFEIPKRVDDFLSMDNSHLDRVLIAYNLSSEFSHGSSYSSPLRRYDHDFFNDRNLEDSRRARILTLFEYLGVDISGERRFGDLGAGESRLGGGRIGCGGQRGLIP